VSGAEVEVLLVLAEGKASVADGKFVWDSFMNASQNKELRTESCDGCRGKIPFYKRGLIDDFPETVRFQSQVPVATVT
jgi:hypothetical protein